MDFNKLSADSKRIISYIQTFVGSQGLYGRLMSDLRHAETEDAEAFLSQFHHCKDCVSFVMEYEGG